MTIEPTTLSVELTEHLRATRRSIYLGRRDGVAVFGTREDHLLAIGPPRCGKTAGLVIPSVAVHPGPVIAVSTRGDIVDATMTARRRLCELRGGLAIEVAFGGSVVHQASVASWAVSSGCADWNTSLERASVLVTAATQGDKDEFWRGAATSILAACLLGAAILGHDDRTLAAHIRTQDIACYAEAVESKWPAGHLALYAFHMVYDPDAMADETRKSLYAVLAAQILGPFNYDLASDTPSLSRFDLNEFVRGWGTLYITIPPERAKDMRALTSSLVEAATSAWRAMRRDSGGEKQDGTLLLALDEVANVAPIPNLPSIITAGAGDGIQCVLGMQEPSQADKWGEQRGVIKNGATHVAIYPGLRDPGYLQSIVDLSPRDVQYETHVSARPDIVHGDRFASNARLIAERRRVEKSKALVEGGATSQLLASRTAARQLLTERVRDGIRPRFPDEETSLSAILKELYACTTIREESVRRSTLEVDHLSGATRGSAFLLSGGTGEFRGINHWSADFLWTKLLN